jgi:putative membrane protein insertion efficiency factor
MTLSVESMYARTSRLPAAVAIGAIGAYRLVLSPMLMAMFGHACRFEPSCSAFAAEALRRHGLLRGVAMASRRLVRCHPLGGHGFDPVPAAHAKVPE